MIYDNEGRRLINFTDDSFFTQWVEEMTRGENLLDLVFTAENSMICSLGVGQCLGGRGQHTITFFGRAPSSSKSLSPTLKPNVRHAGFTGLRVTIDQLALVHGENAQANGWSSRTALWPSRPFFVFYKKLAEKQLQPKWFSRDIAKAIRKKKICTDIWKSLALKTNRRH